MKYIYLIRHGKTPGNEEKKYIGVTDESLSNIGRKEILSNKYPKADIIFSSPMKRCLETAALIYPGRDVSVEEDFRETDFGEFEGKSYDELKNDPSYLKWIESGGTIAFPGGEDRKSVCVRVMKAFRKALPYIKEEETAVFIVHGGTIMTIISELFNSDFYDHQVKNGMGYFFELSPDGDLGGPYLRSFDR